MKIISYKRSNYNISKQCKYLNFPTNYLISNFISSELPSLTELV